MLSPSHLEDEIAIAKLKKYKSPGSDQIPAELIQAGGKILLSAVHKLINSVGIRNNCLISGKSLLLYQFITRVTKLTVIIIVGYHCYQLHTKSYRISYSQGQVCTQMKLLGITSDRHNRSTTDQIFCIRQILEKK
jgi:hypothetical protein